ncbi:MAG: site-specific integrase, partial [Chitinophagaceae bacterium]|nr:site-specific integrase [Chitinophagaceae bacterium]
TIQNTHIEVNKSEFTFSFGTHHQKNVIWIRFLYSKDAIAALKSKFPSVRWSQTQKAWYLPDIPSVREALHLPKKKISDGALNSLSPENANALKRFEEQLILKSYSPSTIQTYTQEFRSLLKLLKHVPVDSLTPERLRDYFLYVHRKYKIKESAMNTKINAIKFYFEQVLHRNSMFFDNPCPKKPLQLPKVLSKQQIKKILSVVKNPKHLLMLKLCYGMGLRVSEIVNLKIEDIDSDTMRVRIENAKGKKDRYVRLPDSILPELRSYYKTFRPKYWLFEGQYGGKYSIRSVQAVFKTAMQKAKIDKRIGMHGLRHSYATHLIEAGADIRYLKNLLGHHSIKTTLRYTHITDIGALKWKSPLDQL